jgi:hypothetical protein
MCRVHQQIASTCAYDLFLYAPHAQTKLIGSMAYQFFSTLCACCDENLLPYAPSSVADPDP